jgi:ankyrin repeat protein
MLAVRGGHLEVARALLAAGADPAHVSRSGATALDWARERRDEELIALLRSD